MKNRKNKRKHMSTDEYYSRKSFLKREIKNQNLIKKCMEDDYLVEEFSCIHG